ncbi:MAG: hypothetical protein HWQ38_26165 [Nostoc sp. NMS7]|nr:hypothetical protein [Nostoc sp. NMS7]MBN3949759.1 hypothetical protein [Nostoc sp. NMS7]
MRPFGRSLRKVKEKVKKKLNLGFAGCDVNNDAFQTSSKTVLADIY